MLTKYTSLFWPILQISLPYTLDVGPQFSNLRPAIQLTRGFPNPVYISDIPNFHLEVLGI